MISQAEFSIRQAVRESLQEAADPLPNFLGINDPAAERCYLQYLEPTYFRTIHDIVHFFNFSPDAKERRILEIGSYMGVVCVTLRKLSFQVYAQDIPEFIENPVIAERLRQNQIPTAALYLDKGTLPWESRFFDAVIMCETLEHLNFNPLPTLHEINRVLKPGGLLYLAVPNHAEIGKRLRLLRGGSAYGPIQSYFKQLDPSCNMIVGLHWREYTARELREMLEPLGFLIQRQYWFSLPESEEKTSLLKRFKALLHAAIPSFRPNITTLAVKSSESSLPLRPLVAPR